MKHCNHAFWGKQGLAAALAAVLLLAAGCGAGNGKAAAETGPDHSAAAAASIRSTERPEARRFATATW